VVGWPLKSDPVSMERTVRPACWAAVWRLATRGGFEMSGHVCLQVSGLIVAAGRGERNQGTPGNAESAVCAICPLWGRAQWVSGMYALERLSTGWEISPDRAATFWGLPRLHGITQICNKGGRVFCAHCSPAPPSWHSHRLKLVVLLAALDQTRIRLCGSGLRSAGSSGGRVDAGRRAVHPAFQNPASVWDDLE